MASFSDALNRRAEDIRRPPPPPLGHYVMRVSKVVSPAEAINTQNFQGKKLTIPVALVSATEDVDEDLLAEFGNITGVNLKLDFLFNEAVGEEMKFEGTLNRLKEFCEKCGVDLSEGSLAEWLEQLSNMQFIGELRHRMNKDNPEEIYPEIGATTAYE